MHRKSMGHSRKKHGAHAHSFAFVRSMPIHSSASPLCQRGRLVLGPIVDDDDVF